MITFNEEIKSGEILHNGCVAKVTIHFINQKPVEAEVVVSGTVPIKDKVKLRFLAYKELDKVFNPADYPITNEGVAV